MKMENGAKTDTTVQVKAAPVEKTDENAQIKAEKPEENSGEAAEKIKDESVDGKEVTKEDVKDVDTKAGVTDEEPPSEELLEKIKSQVEFYFGDINLHRDKFLIEQVKLDEGWIPMTVMLNFKLLASMSKNAEVILKSLESSDLIEVSEDRKKIRRTPDKPLPVFDEAYRKTQAERTVYLKGFPQTDIYIQKLKEFFKDYEPFENIIMRKYQDKDKKLQFKGSIFVQFKTLEGAKAFMARESIKYGDTELIRKWSEDHAVEKAKEKEERKLKKGEKKDKKTDGNEEEAEADDEVDLPKGAVLHFTGHGGVTSREVIKQSLVDLGAEIAFIEYKIGNTEGWIRLQNENAGKALLEKMEDNKLTINNHEVTFRLVEGEEEEKYLAEVKETMRNIRNRNRNYSKRGRSKRGRSGGQRGRKRHGSPGHGAVSAKRAAAE